jgi:TatD DNase family protein
MLVDSHAHIDLEQFSADREEVLARAERAGVQLIVIPGIDIDQSRKALELVELHANLYAAVGVHPNSSADFNPAMIGELRRLAAHPKVVAIGEIGLDYYWDKASPGQQAAAFRSQLDLAAELGLPVIIHNRDAHKDIAAVVREWVSSDHLRRSVLASRPFYGVLHAFSADLALAQEAYQWNFMLSLGGPVTFKNARRLHTLVPQLRLDRLLLETDAPYLTPHPHRGERNEPAYVALVCNKIASLYGIAPAVVAEQTSMAAYRFFGLEGRVFAKSQPGHIAIHAELP